MNTAPRPPDLRHLVQVPNFLGHHESVVHPLDGTTPAGLPVAAALRDPWTLLVFLSTSCDGCAELWRAFSDPNNPPIPGPLTIIVVTRGPEVEGPERVERLCGKTTVMMSDAAWADYGVHSGPFFVLVDGAKEEVATEGVAWSLGQIAGAVAAARGSE